MKANNNINNNMKVAVIGAGLLGRLLAWRLLRQHQRVTLYEASPFNAPRSAAHTAAAMISPFSEVVVSERLVFDLGMESLRLWPEWIAELNGPFPGANRNSDISSGDISGGAIQYCAQGSIAVAHPQDRAELLQFRQDLQHVLGPDDRSQWLDQAQLVQREAQLAHFGEALYLPDEAHLDNRALLPRLLETIARLGGECRDNTPVELDESRLCFADGSTSPLDEFDLVIDCRGMGSKTSDNDLRGVRGEVMWVQSGEVHLQHAVRLMHPRYKLYVVPKPGQRFIIGATEIESEDRSPISLQSTLELASALYTINPALAEARVIETDTNLRPAFPDNMPRIAIAGRRISVNGLYRHGFLLAPAMVDQLCRFVCNEELSDEEQGPLWTRLLRTA